jgi:chemotaxis protein histidine kinase CheA
MNQQMGLREFFAMEAGEYLEQLDGLVSAAAGPDREEFLRIARALRGSALMANQQSIGDAAGGLENLARALREDRISWSAQTQRVAVRGVDDLKILVRKTGTWGVAEDAKAAAVATELNGIAGTSPSGRASGAVDREIDAGTRAFLAREAAAVASSLDQLARAFQRGPVVSEQCDGVFRAMQPLRGLAVLPDLSPVPEFLDGVERALVAAESGVERPDDFALLLDSAARGLSTAAKEIAGTGSAQADSADAREFARRLGAILDVGGNIVPIEDLYFDDDGPHLVEEGTPAAAPGRMVQLELMAHGEHLKQAAEELARAQWDTQRELRALALTATFRSMVAATGGPLEDAVAGFAASAARAVSRRAPVHHTDAFVVQLRKAGAILGASLDGDENDLAMRLVEVTAVLDAIPTAPIDQPAEAGGGPLIRPAAPSAAMSAHIDEEPSAAPPEPEVPKPADVAPEPEVEAPEPEPVAASAEAEDLASSWARYEDVTEEPGQAVLSIDELLAGVTAPSSQPEPEEPVAAPEPEPLTMPAEEPVAGPEPLEEPIAAPVAETVVPIEELCYSGAEALERARAVREQIRGVLGGGDLDRPHLEDLLEELLDLVELGTEPQG